MSRPTISPAAAFSVRHGSPLCDRRADIFRQIQIRSQAGTPAVPEIFMYRGIMYESQLSDDNSDSERVRLISAHNEEMRAIYFSYTSLINLMLFYFGLLSRKFQVSNQSWKGALGNSQSSCILLVPYTSLTSRYFLSVRLIQTSLGAFRPNYIYEIHQ